AISMIGMGGCGASSDGANTPQGGCSAISLSTVDALDRMRGKSGDESLQRVMEVDRVFRLQGDFDFVIRQIENRIRTEHELGKFYQQIVEDRGDHAFAVSDINVLEVVRRIAKHLFDRVKALLEDLRNARKNVNVANLHNRRERRLGRQERGALRHVGHAEPRAVHLIAEALAHAALNIRVTDKL